MRHSPGASNSAWSDMYIETTFMHFGHSQGGLTGLTVNQTATQRWALSLHSYSVLVHDIQAMRDNTEQPSKYHKEETPTQMQAGSSYRMKLQQKLEQCMDPSGHPDELFNIVTG